ncbi:MAG: methyltransferase domain-containing protein, partial [Sedimenticolaceae bacterium]
MQTNTDPAAERDDSPPATLKYDHQLEFRSANNSHVQLLARVPDGAQVLELGCATGYMSEHLSTRKNCRVVGVDIDAASLEKAAPHCRRTLCVDVEAHDWHAPLHGERFDVILCADIIEHLKDPEAFLISLRGLLKDDGRLVASVPNGAHAAIRLELLQGQLTYEDTGLLDRTHLHLYTHHSLMALLSNAGYKVDALSYTFHDIPDEVLAGKLRQAGLEPTDAALARLHAPEAVAYQYIVEARAKAAGDASAVYPELTDKPLRDSEEVYRKVHERLHQAQVVSQRRAEVIDAKARQIAHHENQMMLKEQQLARKDGRIAELKAQVTNQDRRVSALLGSNAKQQQTLQQTQAKLKQTQAKLKQLQHRHAELQRVLSTRSWRAFRALTLPVRG